jgi:hypothetical protein
VRFGSASSTEATAVGEPQDVRRICSERWAPLLSPNNPGTSRAPQDLQPGIGRSLVLWPHVGPSVAVCGVARALPPANIASGDTESCTQREAPVTGEIRPVSRPTSGRRSGAKPVDPGRAKSELAGSAQERRVIEQHLRYVAEYLGPRPVGSSGLTRAQRYLVEVVRELGLAPDRAAFTLAVPFASTATVRRADGRSIPCLPVAGAPSTRKTILGLPELAGSDGGADQPRAEGSTMAVVPFRPGEEEAAIAAATQRGAQAALLYLEQSPELYSAVAREASVPSVTIRRADALYLAERRPAIELSVAMGTNRRRRREYRG